LIVSRVLAATDILGAMASPTWEELKQGTEGHWRLIGPDSGGGTTLYRYRGQLFVVGYGDHSSLPGGAEQVIGVLPDNTPGFAPLMNNGHAAGCFHQKWFSSSSHGKGLRHSWDHALCVLTVFQGRVDLFEKGEQVLTCLAKTFAQEGSEQSLKVLELMGPNVMAEAQRCAASD
jgi:hypothetical protein